VDINDQVWLVTGASSGIGRAVASALARRGARVALAARSMPLLQRSADELTGDGAQAIAVSMDVCRDDSVAAGIGQALSAWGRIDGVANLAGNGGTLARWSDTSARDTQAMFDVHVMGAERVLRAVLPALKRQRRSVVVNIASTVAWVPMPGAAAYSAAKAAVLALSDTWRAELAPCGIDVRVFSPPHTRTDAGLAWPLPLPKIFEPQWVADAFVQWLQRDRVVATPGGNGALLALQRMSPALARCIMHRIGFEALRRVESASAGRCRASGL
jgi:NAD(P)-dependent dehydrogenase (short-subunit alcohol dehydrogenase family)